MKKKYLEYIVLNNILSDTIYCNKLSKEVLETLLTRHSILMDKIVSQY